MTETDAQLSAAVLVIDAQASFAARPYWQDTDLPGWLDAQNRLIDAFAKQGKPIVRVLHVEDTGPFSLESGLVRPIDGLRAFNSALTIHKRAHSAFAGTPLAAWLLRRSIGRVVISGIRTEQCCETTTRDASDRGLQVDYVTEATLTFPMHHANGRVFSPADIKERTELVLAGRFARICTVGALGAV
ncbi:hydrolase [beta proteobacterium AAP99]|nr:hydrolase [beta proteobacterium AAP99]